MSVGNETYKMFSAQLPDVFPICTFTVCVWSMTDKACSFAKLSPHSLPNTKCKANNPSEEVLLNEILVNLQ